MNLIVRMFMQTHNQKQIGIKQMMLCDNLKLSLYMKSNNDNKIIHKNKML